MAHVHDEVIIEGESDIDICKICKVMSKFPDWAKNLPLCVDGYTCEFYKKD